MPKEISRDALKNLGPIRVTMPVSVAYNLESLQNGIASLMSELGCAPCCSGLDVLLMTEREYVLNANLEVSAARDATGLGPNPWRTITLSLPENHDIEAVKDMVAFAANQHGHRLCCSGFDVAFQQAVATAK